MSWVRPDFDDTYASTSRIHIVSLQGGSAELDEVIEVQAPRRDFEECPALDIQGDMIAIVVGGLYGAVSDQNRSLRIIIVNRETGLVYAVSHPFIHSQLKSDRCNLYPAADPSLRIRSRIQLEKLYLRISDNLLTCSQV